MSFFDLTNRDDRFEITPGLLSVFPGGVRSLDGNDAVIGSDGSDTISGNLGNDSLTGAAGPDVLTGGRQQDTLDGGGDSDRLFGNRGSDFLLGGDGADLIHGGRAQDVLDGGAGNDTLWGDFGEDTVRGGAGADVFVLRPDTPEADIIEDWDFNVDRIGLAFGLTVDQIQAVPLNDPAAAAEGAAPPPTGVRLQLNTTGQILAVVLTGRVAEFTNPTRFLEF